MPRERISDETKRRIIEAHENQGDYMEVARVLGVKRGTAWSIVSRFLANGVVARPRGGHRITKIDAEMIETCIQIVEDHAEYTLSQINAELRRRNPNKPIVCDSSISKMLHGQFIKLKKLETIPAERNRADVKVKRREFAEWLNNVRDDHDHELIYIDEAGFNLHMCRTRERAAPGDRAVRVVNGRRGNVKFSIFHFLVFMYM